MKQGKIILSSIQLTARDDSQNSAGDGKPGRWPRRLEFSHANALGFGIVASETMRSSRITSLRAR
ncbi:hypothetical protein N7524_003258 [Penicillium chrysogenum]|nr:hypothetical protein N7524_003258 [Penicillium chrysogenum]